MNFRPELADAVMAGRKWTTYRLVSDNPNSPYHPERAPKAKGKRIAVCPGRGKSQIGTVLIVHVSREQFDPMKVDYATARAEGFVSPGAFWGAWADIHGKFDTVDAWRFEFASPVAA